jgi:crotonobetainyl-CoA:carnitine CoA-transferase CaiB-like acyl-CoA transferase
VVLPLEGIRVLDLTVFQQGTYSTAMLADLGADVIKVEGPDTPDLGRWSGAVAAQTPLNSYFHSLNRGKRAICIDLKHERGREVFHRLVKDADVFVSNMRRPALARLGCDYQTLSQINPRLIYGRASGYGPNGPDADRGSMDILGQARGGIMSQTGDPDRGPKPAGVAIADHVGAMSMAFGLAIALLHRERTGEGQEVDASLLGGQLCIQTFNITDYLWAGRQRGRAKRAGPNPTWSTYQGSDGKWFALGMNWQRYWSRIAATVDRPEWAEDERYATLEARLANADELFAEFDAIFATQPAAEWVRRFTEADLLATLVNDYEAVSKDPQVLSNDYITEVKRGDGEPPVRMVGLPVIFSKTPGYIRGIGPEFGQHTEEVLQEAGLSWDELTELREAGVIGPRPEAETDS